MEKLTESTFGKFEGTQLTNLNFVKGGGETGGGSVGNFFNGYVCWDTDTVSDSGTFTADSPYFLTQEQYVARKTGAIC